MPDAAAIDIIAIIERWADAMSDALDASRRYDAAVERVKAANDGIAAAIAAAQADLRDQLKPIHEINAVRAELGLLPVGEE